VALFDENFQNVRTLCFWEVRKVPFIGLLVLTTSDMRLHALKPRYDTVRTWDNTSASCLTRLPYRNAESAISPYYCLTAVDLYVFADWRVVRLGADVALMP
jgi:hypothetical protein